MGTTVSVRGRLQCDDGQSAQIRKIVEADDPERTYSGGRAFPARRYNDVRWVFHGGGIRAVSLGWFEERLRQIARIPASYQDDDYDDRPRGLFLVSHDGAATSEWRVHNGGLVIGLPDGDHHYLDAWPDHDRTGVPTPSPSPPAPRTP
ncbi:hypothetical protein JS756_32785 [Streptomyces actuosus]|uniref:Uncharacterized protein n=1 Tax=Streptomyces actuosus TaxID=1885 RepID=A0ABS2W038_STRAS|nr:hypothetical protein [Streptomyces actuosus]MBN0048777.1 hypothetical protein [Streptomyces actuosus]